MSYFNWDFTKLPKEEHEKARIAYDNNDIKTLIILHNTYKLSISQYCCGGDLAILKWYKYAIDNNFI